jgi:salicylate hydroxylase
MAGNLIDDRVLVAGAGIGGLSTAIALARNGIPSQVLERSRVFSTDGAGIQLGPNATWILKKWDVLDSLANQAVFPEHIEIQDGRTGGALTRVPLGRAVAERCGAPYMVIHRADLHNALLEHARSLKGIKIRRQFEVTTCATSKNSVMVQARDGARASGTLLVGADGLWSRTRHLIEPSVQTHFSGKTAWRALVDISKLPERFQQTAVGLWMAPSAHLVHYPVRNGNSLNLVAVINDPWADQGWNAPGDRQELMQHFQDWPAEIQELLSHSQKWRKWSLVEMPPLRDWSQGNMVLLGDAAHPALPFLAQGGAMAIEDADALATALSGNAASLKDALHLYEAMRRRRTAAVQTASRRMGRIYHLRGIAAFARNLALRMRRPEALLKSYDWLYRVGADG